MNNKHPRISVGLPVYNGENYLRETLDSILAQTFEDFELIISDNASTDQTQTICQEYAAQDSRIRYYRNATNIGANPNYNRALDLARGEYFKWAAHDDLLAPTFLAHCIEALDRDPSAVLCYSRTVLIDADGQTIPFNSLRNCFVDKAGNTFRKLDRHRHLDSWQANERYREILFGTRWCFEVFGLIRTDLLRRTACLGTYYGSDKVLLVQLSLLGRFIEIPEPLFFNRRHPSQSASLPSARMREIWSNPQKAKRSMSPRLLCVRGYLHAIFWADLKWDVRLRSLTVLANWLVQSENWSRFSAELRADWLKKVPAKAPIKVRAKSA